MKKIGIALSFSLTILLTACIFSPKLQEAYYNESGQTVLTDQKYNFMGPAGNIEKQNKIAYINVENKYKDIVYSIKGYDKQKWILITSNMIMGDWLLYGSENITVIPIDLSNSVLTTYEDTIDFDNNTYQLYTYLPTEQKNITYKKVMGNNKETFYGINEWSTEEWLAIGPNEGNKQFSLYRNKNVTSVPIDIYKYSQGMY